MCVIVVVIAWTLQYIVTLWYAQIERNYVIAWIMHYCGHSGFIIAIMTCLGTRTFSSIIMFLMQAHLLESVDTLCPLPSRWHFQLLNNYWKINISHRVTNDPFSSTLSGWARPVTAMEKNNTMSICATESLCDRTNAAEVSTKWLREGERDMFSIKYLAMLWIFLHYMMFLPWNRKSKKKKPSCDNSDN